MRFIQACECGEWHLRVWHPDNPGSQTRLPYKCRSWRHEGDCRRWKGSQDYVRCKEALQSRKNWIYAVLTFNQANWDNKENQFRYGCLMWSKVRLRLRRKFGKIEYLQTWEQHKNGGAHVNICISNAKIYDLVDADAESFMKKTLKPIAVACGFGWRNWVEVLRNDSEEAMAGYLVKLATELTGSGEKSQVPTNAPPHFRRIRASQGLLPPPNKSEMTGTLVFAELPEECKVKGRVEARRYVRQECRQKTEQSDV